MLELNFSSTKLIYLIPLIDKYIFKLIIKIKKTYVIFFNYPKDSEYNYLCYLSSFLILFLIVLKNLTLFL